MQFMSGCMIKEKKEHMSWECGDTVSYSKSINSELVRSENIKVEMGSFHEFVAPNLET